MANSLVWLLLVSALMGTVTSQDGTTPNLKAVFLGRCYDYPNSNFGSELPPVSADCQELWEDFHEAFANKAPCDVSEPDYRQFFQAARQELPRNKAMLWSGTNVLAHEYAELGRRYVTLEDTLIGYLVNGLLWCGQLADPGINYDTCPIFTTCPPEARESFWSGASMTFARSIRGNVTLMVDGSNEDMPAYREDSYFARYELPNLDTSLVDSVNVLVVHALGEPDIETCGHGTLQTLARAVRARGLGFTCNDNSRSVLHLLCAEDPQSRECRRVLENRFRLTGPNVLPDLNEVLSLLQRHWQ